MGDQAQAPNSDTKMQLGETGLSVERGPNEKGVYEQQVGRPSAWWMATSALE